MIRSRLLVCGFLFLTATTARAADSSSLRTIFADPPRQYSSAPLWVWNDMLTEEQIVGTLGDLAAQKVKQAFVHPRPGLMTPYLSADWFRLWKTALREAERLDMNLWIYDENSYPSGFAGGWVPELMPESRGRGLVLRETKSPGRPGADVLAVYQLTPEGYKDVTARARAGESLPEAPYLVAAVQRATNSPWHGDRCYVDLMYPGVTEKFLEVTLGAYQREIGKEFGRRVPGSFTDEPNICPAGGLPWTDHLPAEFQRRWGYSLTDHLPSLVRPLGDWKRVRHDYYQVLLEQFIEHWGKPYREYCEKHGLEFTGHYWDHEWPNCKGVPDNMAMAAWEHRPGIDCLMNQYREDTHAQFGNVRIAKEVASVANQLGRPRTLCELYGAGGWDLRFEDMKRIGDWLEVLGINTLDEHLSYVTLRGARKADHPQSFSYHEPWWPAYHVVTQHFTRLSAAMSHGEQVNQILVIEPTTTAWMYQGDEAALTRVGKGFCDLLMSLEQAQVEYDIGCEDVIARHGAVAKNRSLADMVVGKRHYRQVVLPPNTETLNAKTMDLLEAYVKAGGQVLCCGPAPSLVDGRPSDRCRKLAQSENWRNVDMGALLKLLDAAQRLPSKETAPAICRCDTIVKRNQDDKGILFHHRRQFDDGDLLLLVNTSLDAPSSGVVRSLKHGVERWDLETGAVVAQSFTKGEDYGIELPFTLPPAGSLLLFFTKNETKSATEPLAQTVTIQPAGRPEVQRVEPNVLTLDYMDVTAGGETKKATYFHGGNQFAFVKNGMARNPWDSAVQFKDELISKKFPPGSGFEATYRFTIEREVPAALEIVIERPDLYTITCNGKPVSARPKAWWLDRCFGRIDLAAVARVGENAVTIKASPMTIYHELEPAYLRGNFSLRAAKSGFVVAPPARLDLGPWDKQGHPFYAAGVTYSEKFELEQVSKTSRYRVALGRWYGSVARVTVNGKEAGSMAWQPWECDVTEYLQAGTNTIDVTVIGTLKNTLGPHHAGPGVGTAWPSMFHQGPETGPPAGAAYQTICYGLFEPFVLRKE